MEAAAQSHSKHGVIGSVMLATRDELFQLLSFLDSRLPSTCPVSNDADVLQC